MFVRKPYELRAAHEHNVQYYRRALPYFDFPGEHVTIPYEGGATMYGILRKPWHTPKPPVVILTPGLDSVKEEMHNYGDDFLRRGVGGLCFVGHGKRRWGFDDLLRCEFESPSTQTT